MRFERIRIEAAGDAVTLGLHPRLTVIAGVGPTERKALVGELVGAIGYTSSGVELDVVEDSGRRLTISSPRSGAHRVIDSERSVDVSNEFRRHDQIDVLGSNGLDAAAAYQLLRLGSAGLQTEVEEARKTRPVQRAAIGAAGCIAGVVIAITDPVKNTPLIALAIVAVALGLLFRSRLIPLPWAGQHLAVTDTLDSRLDNMRHLGRAGEAFPLILDEPFAGLDIDTTTALLDVVAQRAGDPQVIVLTEDDRVAAWGRAEALSGDAAIVESQLDEPQAAGHRGAPTA